MIKKCLFPVAGYGTRFLPATKSMPKEMLPVVNKPLVQYGVEEAIEAGMTTCAMVTGRGKRAIADHFDISYELEHQISGSGKEAYLASIRNVLEKGVIPDRQRAFRSIAVRRPVYQRWTGCTGADGGAVQAVSLLYRCHPGSACRRDPQIWRDIRREPQGRHLPG
jgi:hypothetical protein